MAVALSAGASVDKVSVIIAWGTEIDGYSGHFEPISSHHAPMAEGEYEADLLRDYVMRTGYLQGSN